MLLLHVGRHQNQVSFDGIHDPYAVLSRALAKLVLYLFRPSQLASSYIYERSKKHVGGTRSDGLLNKRGCTRTRQQRVTRPT